MDEEKKYEIKKEGMADIREFKELLKGIFNIANELARRNDIEYADRIMPDEDKYNTYMALQEERRKQ